MISLIIFYRGVPPYNRDVDETKADKLLHKKADKFKYKSRQAKIHTQADKLRNKSRQVKKTLNQTS
jgi:hypothetical protein